MGAAAQRPRRARRLGFPGCRDDRKRPRGGGPIQAPPPYSRPAPARRFLPTRKQILGLKGRFPGEGFTVSRSNSLVGAPSALSSAPRGRRPADVAVPARGQPRLVHRRSAAGSGGKLAFQEEGQTQGPCPASQPSKAPPVLNIETGAHSQS